MATAVAERVEAKEEQPSPAPELDTKEVAAQAERPGNPNSQLGYLAIKAVDGFTAPINEMHLGRIDRLRIHTGRLIIRRPMPVIIGPHDPEPNLGKLLGSNLEADARAAVAAAYNPATTGAR